jgi:hypothetical protein
MLQSEAYLSRLMVDGKRLRLCSPHRATPEIGMPLTNFDQFTPLSARLEAMALRQARRPTLLLTTCWIMLVRNVP